MIIFNRSTGTIYRAPDAGPHSGEIIATGIWSGHGDAANDPSRESEHGIGPLPAGVYEIGPMRDSATLGPHVMDLTQISGNTFGRSLFRIHGDTVNDANHAASDGCIIAPRTARDLINTLSDRRITVI